MVLVHSALLITGCPLSTTQVLTLAVQLPLNFSNTLCISPGLLNSIQVLAAVAESTAFHTGSSAAFSWLSAVLFVAFSHAVKTQSKEKNSE